MMDIEFWSFFCLFIGGLILGMGYFFLLWRSVHILQNNHSVWGFVLLFFVRISLLLSLFYVLANNHLMKYLILISAFFIAKWSAVRISEKLKGA